jgi:hypothetical protein
MSSLINVSFDSPSLFECLRRGQRYLDHNAKQFVAETENNLTFKDNFIELLILEATGNWNLVDLRIPTGKWNYFGSKPVVTTDPYPEDIDTNSIAASIMKPVDSIAHSLMDEMLQCANEDGIIQLYYDPSRPRIVPEVATNVLTFFYTWNRGHEIQKTLDWVYSVLQNRSHHPSRYYFTPEPFFYYLRRLVHSSNEPELDEIKELLIIRVRERIGTQTENAVCLAIRLILCHDFNIPNDEDLPALLRLQEADGSFGVGWFFAFGRTNIKIGHRGLTCALSTEAIKVYQGKKMFKDVSSKI